VNVATGAALEFMGFHGSTAVSRDAHSADYERFSQFNSSCAQQCMPTCAPIYDATSTDDPFVDPSLWQKQVGAQVVYWHLVIEARRGHGGVVVVVMVVVRLRLGLCCCRRFEAACVFLFLAFLSRLLFWWARLLAPRPCAAVGVSL
jgi:hypothetical protein